MIKYRKEEFEYVTARTVTLFNFFNFGLHTEKFPYANHYGVFLGIRSRQIHFTLRNYKNVLRMNRYDA